MKASKYFLQIIFLFFFTLTIFAQNKGGISKPEEQFEQFWRAFKDHYAFFDLKKVNWDTVYQTYRPKVNSKTKEQDLIQLFQEMVAPLKDGHITISKGDKVIFKAQKPSYFKQEFKGKEDEFWSMVEGTLVQNGFSKPKPIGPTFKGIALFYYGQSAELGYLRITRCFGEVSSLFDDDLEKKDIQIMERMLDSILTMQAPKRGLIIDLRGNGGGHGGLEMASRFVQLRQLTHYKATKIPGSDSSYTKKEAFYSQLFQGYRYTQPIVVLTNDKTASSAEDFTLTLSSQPHVQLVGTPTSGMLSDMYAIELNDEITVTLSNQVYYGPDDQILEDNGVPIDIEITNSKEDLVTQKDPVVEKALERLKK